MIHIPSISVVIRTSGVMLHIEAAQRGALRCRDLECEYNSDTAGPVLAELRQQCAISVILGACAIEAFSNELLFDYVPEFKGLDFKRLRVEQREFLKSHAHHPLPPITADPLEYCDAYLGMLHKPGLDLTSASSVDEEASTLFRTRNGLVHFWPEWGRSSKC